MSGIDRDRSSPSKRLEGIADALDESLELSEGLELLLDPLLEKPVVSLRGELHALRARVNRLVQWARTSRR